MGIKWKNKIVTVVWMILLVIGVSGVGNAVLNIDGLLRYNYYHTHEFEGDLQNFKHLLAKQELFYMDEEEARNALTVTEAEINEHRNRYGTLADQLQSIREQYDYRIEEADAEGNKDVEEALKKERDTKLEDISKNFSSDEHIRKKILKQKEEVITAFYQELASEKAEFDRLQQVFAYFLVDRDTGQSFTNVSADGNAFINEKNMYYTESIDTSFDEVSSYTEEYYHSTDEYELNVFPDVFKNENHVFKGKIGVSRTAPNNHPIIEKAQTFEQNYMKFIIFLGISIVALAVSFLIYRKTRVMENFQLPKALESNIRKIPIDIRVAIFLFTIIYFLFSVSHISHVFLYAEDLFVSRFLIKELFISLIVIGVILLQLMILKKDKPLYSSWDELWESTFIRRLWILGKEAFENRKAATKVLIVFLLVFLLGCGAFFVGIEPEMIFLYIIVFFLVSVPLFILIANRLRYFNKILANTRGLTEGRAVADLPVKKKSELGKLASHVNELKQGVTQSRHEQYKSERLKTELITNVSHDLRTPLTSIITYTELLKDPNLQEDEKKAYLEIIDRKSKRLKGLIEDLFEVSKMSSGNIELIKEKVDLVQLVQQAMAEYEEKIAESDLQFRFSHTDSPIYAVVDGQKLWRVFDNLIGNAIKYSLDHTRVYIAIEEKTDRAIITFKNITKYELGSNTDELIERFKRGDTSRHTEGSGLGLAIAKSIIDLHEGQMDIDVDGDLFKITITLFL